ncbi:MAG: division plane positioning ATPase MipZ [Pseudomonadota bacterium]
MRPHIVVLGNEKGGSGKSTTAMHITIACLKMGMNVGVLDLDGRQRTLARYLENRVEFGERHGLNLKVPHFAALTPLDSDGDQSMTLEEKEALLLDQAVAEIGKGKDIIVVDCPGSNTNLGRLGHLLADTLVTPINDSFVDFDLLAKVDPDSLKVKRPSFYSEMVWNARQQRASVGGTPIDWVVMRNRLSHLNARNKERVDRALKDLSRRVGFRYLDGLSERVIYREMFINGLTLLDLREANPSGGMTMSHVAARQELRDLMIALKLPGFEENLSARTA